MTKREAMAQGGPALVEAAPVRLIVRTAAVRRTEIGARIRGMYDVVYGWLGEQGLRAGGHNHALYDECTADTLRVRVGVPSDAAVPAGAPVEALEFAGGRAARIVHRGPYSELSRSYAALEKWCAEQELKGSGVSWEVYGDWTDDPSKLETTIFLGVRGS